VQRHEDTRTQPAVLRAWCESYDYQLKFVISTADDLAEAQSVIASIGLPIPPEKVLLMPEGTSAEAIQSRTSLLVEACKTHGYRYSPRLHIDLFGNRRGT
jgi:7-carboxy-7-deazaguanine synthase